MYTSEKGKPGTNATKFNPLSIFGFVEQKFTPVVDSMICDDMSTEWGDHISISRDEIAFYHSIYDSPSLSSSKLYVVFGQAQKNLTFISMTDEMVDKRKKRWTGKHKKTQIKRG